MKQEAPASEWPRGPGSRVAGILGGTQELRALKPPIEGLDESESTGYYFHWVFPLTTINFTPDGILMFRVRPLGPERTQTEFMWWFPDARSFEDRLLQAAVVNFGHLVNTEDYEICERAQRGMRSQVYRQGRYSAEQEICLRTGSTDGAERKRDRKHGWRHRLPFAGTHGDRTREPADHCAGGQAAGDRQ